MFAEPRDVRCSQRPRPIPFRFSAKGAHDRQRNGDGGPSSYLTVTAMLPMAGLAASAAVAVTVMEPLLAVLSALMVASVSSLSAAIVPPPSTESPSEAS